MVLNGEYKLAKYGQWDGYREGVGADILKFLRDEFNREKFIKGLQQLKPVTDAEYKALWNACGADPNSDMVTMDVSAKFQKAHPELSRDPSGGEVLRIIQAGKAKYSNPNISFAADSLFCEWAYVVDLDKNTFEIYEGFNETPLDPSERFAGVPLEKESGRKREYYQVRLLKSYSLRRLPTVETMLRVPSFSSRRQRAKKQAEKNNLVAA